MGEPCIYKLRAVVAFSKTWSFAHSERKVGSIITTYFLLSSRVCIGKCNSFPFNMWSLIGGGGVTYLQSFPRGGEITEARLRRRLHLVCLGHRIYELIFS